MVSRVTTPLGPVAAVTPTERVTRLQPGDTLVARVAQHLNQNAMRLAAGAFHIDVEAGELLPLGTEVALSSRTDGKETHLTMVRRDGGRAPVPDGRTLAVSPATIEAPDRLAALLPKLATLQDGHAPLFAGVTAIAASGGAGLPANVQAAIAGLLGLRLAGGPGIDGESLHRAVQQCAAFGSDDEPTLDSALSGLCRALRAVVGVAVPRQSAPPPPPNLSRHPRGQAAEQPSPELLRALAVPDAGAAASILLGKAEGALARLRLSGLASAGRLDAGGPAAAATPMDLTLEVPIALVTETVVAELQIGHDEAEGRDGEPSHSAWRLRLALDLAEIGAVEAVVGLDRRRLFVTLWVERSETLAKMARQREALEAELADLGLEVVDFRLLRGRPSDPPARSGQFVDTVS